MSSAPNLAEFHAFEHAGWQGAARGARVTAVDFSSAMVELARSQNPGIEFREGDAEALPFPEGSFDAVVMNFGMLHLASPERAVSEALRVLDRKSTRLNSSHIQKSRMPSSA